MVAGRVSNYTRSCLTAHALPWSSSSSSSDVGGRWPIPAGRPGRIELAVLDDRAAAWRHLHHQPAAAGRAPKSRVRCLPYCSSDYRAN